MLLAALLVRRIARQTILTGRYLALAVRRVRWEPGLRSYLIFLRCRRVRTDRDARLGLADRLDLPGCLNLPGRAAMSPSGETRHVRLLNPPSPPPTLLRDTRVRRLQERAARVLFTREFDLTIAGSEVAVLGAFSSLAWLRGNLLTAAGCDGVWMITREELRERCRVVYPVFIRTMTMHRRMMEYGMVPPRGELRRRWIRRRCRQYGVGEDGEILDSFYPRAIPEARRRLRRYRQREETRRIYRSERAAYHLTRFDRYLEAITLVSKAGVTVPARATRTLDALHRVYQRSTAGGTLWQRGARNRKRWI
ncbi:MAG: hypothetical protein EA427_03210 [Spirochaetaceae bacterium]|nr:MAG: hypothetical protein EA427_03210 [Spirochaetaceae bacterium]